jgi:hypothetical protein
VPYFQQRGVDVALCELTAAEDADGHYQAIRGLSRNLCIGRTNNEAISSHVRRLLHFARNDAE